MNQYLVLAICFLFSFVFGMFYWGSLVAKLFSKFSFAIDGRKPNTDPAHMRLCYTFTTLSAFVTNYLLMRGILSVGVADGSGILVAAFIVLAQAAYDLNHSFWENRPWQSIALRIGYAVINNFINAAIMTRLL